MGFAENDLAAFYADFGVEVTHTPLVGAPVTDLALFNQPGTAILGGEVLATDYSLRYPVTTFPAVKRGDAFLIGALTYTARDNAQSAAVDGLEHVVPLARA